MTMTFVAQVRGRNNIKMVMYIVDITLPGWANFQWTAPLKVQITFSFTFSRSVFKSRT